ncbi:hypothetical protein K2173_002733 [Erythroxylum novogranatense]|uniref:RING-type E3 ubiquitin transferase n=1 Tax=Erythroxylum novogranatense TaxID=1862640 RepID=A0AAV8SPQ2_9ROSI|nr:hypothetical protein K2173_002733 [Erythroxylum novogranatense]
MSSSSSLPPQASNFSTPSLTIVLTTILVVCFFIGFFSIYFCRCFMDSIMRTWHLRRTPSGNLLNAANFPVNQGLDPALVQIFPTFTYSSVKDVGRDKYGLECAICLAEFTDDDLLRLITVCYHVFHQECIDLWLGSHKTCPVCRGDLDLPKGTLEKTLTANQNSDIHDGDESNDGAIGNSVCIAIQEERGSNGEGLPPGNVEENDTNGVFGRSHSTGHSIVEGRGEEDRHTLRLQEHVRVKIASRHGAVRSCTAFGEFSSPKSSGLIAAV